MVLELGPDNLKTTFTFDIFEGLKKPRKIDSIGVFLSGGLDSAALLCLILTELKNTESQLPVKCFTVIKDDYGIEYAEKVLVAINKKFQTNIQHFTNIVNENKNNYNIGKATFIKLYIQHPNTLFYVALNRMPKNVNFKHKLHTDYGYDKDKKFFYSPFLFLDKSQILDIFYKINCEDIIPYTYSCTSNSEIPCMDCYSCEEREYGFKMLNKTDPLLAQNQLTAK